MFTCEAFAVKRSSNSTYGKILNPFARRRQADKGSSSRSSQIYSTSTATRCTFDATAKVEVSQKKKTKKPSKFAQLMAGEHIPIPESASSTSLEELLNGFEKEQEKNHRNKFKLEWTKTGILSTLPESAPNSDKPPSIYTCTLPDDDIALSTDLGELIESGGVQMQEPELHNRREMHYIPSLLTQNQVQSLLDVITAHIDYQEAQARLNPNSNAQAAKCLVAVEDGERQYIDDEDHMNSEVEDATNNGRVSLPCITQILEPMIQNQILPAARFICKEESVVVADSLVRWYIAENENVSTHCDEENASSSNGGGRTLFGEALPPHYDLTSFATMILPLNPEECRGGLYVQYGASHDTRCTVTFDGRHNCDDGDAVDRIKNGRKDIKGNGNGMRRGDAILHRYDVMHGVQLNEGTRYSLILWMAQDEESLQKKAVPWVTRDALEKRSVHAAFLHGFNADYGMYGVEKSVTETRLYWEWAAKRGHALSQYNLAMFFMRGYKYFKDEEDHGEEDENESWRLRIVSLLTESAERGLDLAQHALATEYKYGYHGVKKDDDIAKYWYSAAAKQGYGRSIQALLDVSRWS